MGRSNPGTTWHSGSIATLIFGPECYSPPPIWHSDASAFQAVGPDRQFYYLHQINRESAPETPSDARRENAITISCHRVVRTDESLSAYHWGVEHNAELLARGGLKVAAPNVRESATGDTGSRRMNVEALRAGAAPSV